MIIELIAGETGLNPLVLTSLAQTASRRYKTYAIPKRTGGERLISQPTPSVKFLQRWVVRNVFHRLPVHSAVKSYRVGVGVRANAEIHLNQNYLLKMDFSDFFPSIRSDDIRRLLLGANLGDLGTLSTDDIDLVTNIVCRNGALTIGAPSSPAISNAVLFEFDSLVDDRCKQLGVAYSRYADDLSFSTNSPNVLSQVFRDVSDLVGRQVSPKLSVNLGKTVFTSAKHKRTVTGLFLTPEKKISVGRDQKRKLKTLCFLFKSGRLPPTEASYLRGYLAYIKAVEPTFIGTLEKKFGAATIYRVLSLEPVRRKP